MNHLTLSLIHLNIRHKQPEQNREHLISLAKKAARQGADIIVAPEMAIPGYSFRSRDDIFPYAETETGPTLTALSRIAEAFGVYICTGLAEKDARTGILYNSAFVSGPDGKRICRYRKINAESRWACPGNPTEDNTFETPWGRIGLLICSDTYYGLMPRITMLRGADMVLVPANWPPSGLDPLELWRARAVENGIYLAGCNRTGKDLMMDCRKAASCVFDPEGESLLDGRHEDSRIFTVHLPLTLSGRLDSRMRERFMNDRRPGHGYDAYLNLRMIPDLTDFHKLPEPGALSVHCIVPKKNKHPADAVDDRLLKTELREGSLLLLPSFPYSEEAVKRLAEVARSKKIGILSCRPKKNKQRFFLFENGSCPKQWSVPRWPFDYGIRFPRINFGAARLHLFPFPALAHPELAVAASKQGCDMAVVIEESLSPKQCLLAGVRTIEQIAAAGCARNRAGIWNTPEGHQRWEEVAAEPGGSCQFELDTGRKRRKKFQDRVDFETLLR